MELTKSFIKQLPLLSLFTALAGCAGEALPDDELNVSPMTLAEAEIEIGRGDDRLKANPNDQKTLAAMHRLRDHVDRLTGIIANVDIAIGHTVSFFESAAGLVGIRELHPQGKPSALAGLNGGELSAVELFKRLAPAREVPAALVQAVARIGTTSPSAAVSEAAPASEGGGLASAVPAVATGDVQSVQSALTAADGQWFRDNRCPKWGTFRFCHPDWGGGGFAEGTHGNSRFFLAPFSGSSVTLRAKYNGSVVATFPVFVGEDMSFILSGPLYAPCCIICACQKVSKPGFMRWDILNATGDGFHWGGNMYNGIP